MKKIICILTIVLIILSLVACDEGTDGSQASSPEELIKEAVLQKAAGEYKLITLGEKELKSSYAVVTTIQKISDFEYRVSGRISMVDVYATEWKNTFDCTVHLTSIGTWRVSGEGFKYTNQMWEKDN